MVINPRKRARRMEANMDIKQEIEKKVATVQLISEVNNKEDYEIAEEVLKRAKRVKRELIEKRKELTKPLDLSKKRIMDMFRPAIAKVEAVESEISGAMSKYIKKLEIEREKALAEQKKAEEKLEKLTEKLAEGGRVEKSITKQLEKVAEIEIPEKAKNVRELYTYEIVDELALPREYLMPDMKKIGAVVRALKGKTNIPGVKVFVKHVIVSR